jgi:hypothetical protein
MSDIPTTPSIGPIGADHPLIVGGAQIVDAVVKLLQARAFSDEDAEAREARRTARLRALKETCRALAAQNAWLAGAVGACGCWGTDPLCAACAGRGRPGVMAVNAAAFAEVVGPLIECRPDLFKRRPPGRRDDRNTNGEGGKTHA